MAFCLTAKIILLLAGFAAAQLTTITSCIGDDVTYTCTVDSLVHRWDFGRAPFTVSSGDPLNDPVSVGVYTLERVAGGSRILSTLSVTAFAGLNGTQISCRDALALPQEAERQQTTAFVLGRPTSPSLTVVAESLQRIFFSISPPSYAIQCVLNYTITVTSSEGSVLPDITVEVSDNITLSVGGFDSCNNAYTFTVVANTFTGPGQRSAVVSPEVTHLLAPTLDLTASQFTVSISGIEPTNFVSSTVSIQRSSPDGDSCEESVVNQMGSMVTVMDTLRCRYAGRRVTYCLQFRTSECQSIVTTETVDINYNLLSSVHNIPSSTSESISILVNVDEQINCADVEGLTITATIVEGNRIVSTPQQTNYSDTVITFRSISAGDYTCMVTIEVGTVTVESMQIPCTVNRADPPVSVIVGVVCSVCCLVIGVLIGVLANAASHKCKKASRVGQSATAPPPPVYEEVESRRGQVKVHKKEQFQLEENKAYGHVN